jgi:mycofactocin precursor
MQQGTRADDAPASTVPLSAGVTSQPGSRGEEAGITEELLVEEVSIDGMCGVY